MKDYLLQLVARQPSYNSKLNIMREYLQAYVLRSMQDFGVFRSTAFLGGTALRFLYDLPRFSEDLDFSRAEETPLDFIQMLEMIKSELVAAGYSVGVSYNEEKTVQHAFIKFTGLMKDVGLSPMASQTFSIKIEIDTNPPMGAVLRTDIINKYFPVSFLSYDLPSLLAGKTHALLTRKYVKGRDFFDLGWYLSKWKNIAPNFEMLHQALKQTKYTGDLPRPDNWKQSLQEVVKRVDWKKVDDDVTNFLENPSDRAVFTKENVLGLLTSN